MSVGIWLPSYIDMCTHFGTFDSTSIWALTPANTEQYVGLRNVCKAALQMEGQVTTVKVLNVISTYQSARGWEMHKNVDVIREDI
jgi:hypothetical protein